MAKRTDGPTPYELLVEDLGGALDYRGRPHLSPSPPQEPKPRQQNADGRPVPVKWWSDVGYEHHELVDGLLAYPGWTGAGDADRPERVQRLRALLEAVDEFHLAEVDSILATGGSHRDLAPLYGVMSRQGVAGRVAALRERVEGLRGQ